MATAKKKSPAKKATTKKKVSAAKVSNKKVSTKAPIKQTAKSAPLKMSKLELVRRFHLFSAGVSVLLAIATVFLLSDIASNYTFSFSAKDPIASTTSTVLSPATESFATAEFKYSVVALLAVSALLSILLATVLRKRYEDGVSTGTPLIRWIFTGITAGIVLKLVAVLAGIQDVVTLSMIVALIILTTTLGWASERENKGVNRPVWTAYLISLVTGTLAWIPIIVALLATLAFGTERFGWHVYALSILTLIGFTRFAVIQYRSIKYPAIYKEYVTLEDKYLSNELFIRLAFVAVVFIALMD